MSRLIKKTDTQPKKVADKFICMCGLSKDQPFCDGSHAKTEGEVNGKLYIYKNNKREEIEEIEEDHCKNCEDCSC